MARKGVSTADGCRMKSHGRIIETEVFPFDELPKDVQGKIIENMWDINVDHEWWHQDGLLDLTYSEMNKIGVKLSDDWWKSNKPKDSKGNIIGEYPAYTGLIKYKIDEFDIDRDSYIKFEDIYIMDEEIFRKYLGIDKALWDKLYLDFDNTGMNRSTKIAFIEDVVGEYFTKKEEKILENASEIWDNKVNEALNSIRKDYEWRTSPEAIVETIEANEYEFDINGRMV